MKKNLRLLLMLLGILSTVFGENRTIKDGDTVYIKNMGAQQYVAVADSKLVGRSDVKTKFKIKFSDPEKRGNIVFGNIVYFELEGDNGEKFYIGSAGDSPNPIFLKKVKLLGLKDQKYQALYFKISRYASWPSGDVISGNRLLLEVAQYTNYFFRFNLYEGGGNEIFMAPDYTNMNFDRSTKELSLELVVSETVEKEIAKPALPVEPHVPGVPSSEIEEPEEEYEETLEDQIDNAKTLKDLETISKKYPIVLSDPEYKKNYDVKKRELSAIVKKVVDLPILKKEAEKSVVANKNVIKKFYTIFNLSDDADEKRIASAYRKLANVFHPDKPLGNIEIFNKVQSAKDILIAYKHFIEKKADKPELELLSKSEGFPKISQPEMKAIEAAKKEVSAIEKREVVLPLLKKEAEKSIQVNKKVIDSFYKIFNLNEYARVDEITKAFKKFALVFHPDKPQGNKEIYEKIQQTKNVLIALINFKAGKADETELKLLGQAEVLPKITQTDMKAIEAAGKEIKKEKQGVEIPSWKPGQKPVLDQKGAEVEEKESVSIKWGDEVYIENLKIKQYATRDGNVLLGQKNPNKQAVFIIVADMEKKDLKKGKPIKYGEAGYLKSSTTSGFIGDSEEKYTIYGMKRHLLGVVNKKDKIHKFTILPSTGKKDGQSVCYGDKIKLQYKIPTSKSPIKYFRFNVDVSTYKGTEVFGSDESKLMTALAKKFTKELIFKRASEEKALDRTGLKIGEKFVFNEKGEALISFIKNDFDDATKMGQIANFLDSGADINYKDKYGKTTLHYAAQMGNLIMVEWLIKSGANPNLKDNDGKMPYDLAKNATVKSFLKSK